MYPAALTGNCRVCSEPLYIPNEFSDDDDIIPSSSTPDHGIVDDVELPCGCHFHYSCFEDEYVNASSTSKLACPSCHASIASHTNQLLVTLRNEGGEQHHHDIAAALDEEAYFDANPALKRARAFLEFCASGDTEMVEEMLATDQEGVLGDAEDTEGRKPVHVAVVEGRRQVLKILVAAGLGGAAATDAQGRTWQVYARERRVPDADIEKVGAFAPVDTEQ